MLNGNRNHTRLYRLLDEPLMLTPDGCVTSNAAGNRPLITITSLLSTPEDLRMKIRAVNNFNGSVMPRQNPIRGTLCAEFVATCRKSNKLVDLEEKELLP
jgi:hypothetical protein